MPELSTILIFAAAASCVFGLAALLDNPGPAPVTILRGGQSNRVLQIVGRRFRPSEAERQANRVWLLQAGFESPDAVQNYKATRMLLMLSLPLVVIVLMPILHPFAPMGLTLTIAIASSACGLILPLFYVRRRRKRNQRACRRGLPDALDLLLICSEAGLGIDTAIMRVGEETASIHPVISRHLLYTSSELRAGRPRADAFRSFGDRTGIPETIMLVNLLIQSDALGTSMAQTLRAFSEDMRAHRLLRAEEEGQKVSVKLTLVLAGLLLPALLVAIMSPIVHRALGTHLSIGG